MKKYFLAIFTFCFFQLNAEVKLEDCASIKSDTLDSVQLSPSRFPDINI